MRFGVARCFPAFRSFALVALRLIAQGRICVLGHRLDDRSGFGGFYLRRFVKHREPNRVIGIARKRPQQWQRIFVRVLADRENSRTANGLFGRESIGFTAYGIRIFAQSMLPIVLSLTLKIVRILASSRVVIETCARLSFGSPFVRASVHQLKAI